MASDQEDQDLQAIRQWRDGGYRDALVDGEFYYLPEHDLLVMAVWEPTVRRWLLTNDDDLLLWAVPSVIIELTGRRKLGLTLLCPTADGEPVCYGTDDDLERVTGFNTEPRLLL